MTIFRIFIRSLLLSVALLSPLWAQEPVNINTADAETLALGLNGVGEARAQAIVKWREQHGAFASVEQLLEIKGVGEKLLEKNRDLIVLE